MENRSIITFTIITIGLILIFRLRNKDRQFTKIEVNGKLSNILLFPVAIYGETTIMSMIICIIYASLDETHQLFVYGRTAQVLDVLIDSIGSLISMLIIKIIKIL